MILSLPLPGIGAGIRAPDLSLIHLAQSGHQEPGCSVAPFSHSSSVGATLRDAADGGGQLAQPGPSLGPSEVLESPAVLLGSEQAIAEHHRAAADIAG